MVMGHTFAPLPPPIQTSINFESLTELRLRSLKRYHFQTWQVNSFQGALSSGWFRRIFPNLAITKVSKAVERSIRQFDEGSAARVPLHLDVFSLALSKGVIV